MKSNAVKLLSLVLVLMFVVTAVACAKPVNNGPDTDDPSATTAGDTATPESTADPAFISDIPDNLDYGERVINLFSTGQSFSADEFDSDAISGDVVNDAVYKRNIAVESKLNVKLNVTVASSSSVYNVGDAVRNAVSSGDKSYDICTMPGYTNTSYVLEGDFYNLLDVDNLDLTKLYWTQGFNQIISNGKKQYVASGAYSLSMYRNMYITIYDREALSGRGLADIYDLVMAGEWTIDKQLELATGMYNNANGNSKADLGDYYGFASGSFTSIDPYWVSFEMEYLKLDDGMYSINIDKNKLSSIVDILQSMLFNNEDVLCIGKDGSLDGTTTTGIIGQFNEGNVAMATAIVYMIESYLTPNNCTIDYGIAPIPKYNAEQEEYHTHVQDQLSVIAIVATVAESDLPMMGAVLETIAAESYDYVYNAYYNTALTYKYLQNPQSAQMLDIIYRSIKIEGAFIYSAKFALLGKLRTLISSGVNSTASTVKIYQKPLENGAKDLNESLEALTH